MPEPVARIRKVVSRGGEAIVHVLRAPQNVVPGTVPPVMLVKARSTISYKDFAAGGGLGIGDQVFTGNTATVEIEFLIGGAVYVAPNNSVQIAGERHAIPIGETASRQTRQLLKDVAWQVAPILLAGGLTAGAAYAYTGSAFAAGVAFDAGAIPVWALRSLQPAAWKSGGGGIGPAAGIKG